MFVARSYSTKWGLDAHPYTLSLESSIAPSPFPAFRQHIASVPAPVQNIRIKAHADLSKKVADLPNIWRRHHTTRLQTVLSGTTRRPSLASESNLNRRTHAYRKIVGI